MKRIISLLMAILLILTFIPGSMIFAAAEEISDIHINNSAHEVSVELSDEDVEIHQAETSDDFAEAVSELISTNDTGEYFSTIVINQQENTVSIDGNEAETADENIIKGDVINFKDESSGIDVFSILPEEATQELSKAIENEETDEASKSIKSNFIPVSTLEENGYQVTENENSEIVISNPYQTKRLIVRTESSDGLKTTYGASEVISDGEGCFILQYETVKETMVAYDSISEENYINSVTTDNVVSVSQISNEITQSSNPLLQPGRDRWGAEKTESDRFKEYLSSGNKNTEIVVAVIDTGADLDHPFIKDRLISGYDFIDNDSVPDDKNMHGTHCSGIVKDNTPDTVKIMPVKVFNSDGRATDLHISLGINYAVKNGADILSMSFGGDCSSDTCEIAIAVKNAVKAGIVCVAAAGNEAENTKNKCPAKLDECIVVSSVGVGDIISWFSNYGDSVDIAAPGEYIWSSTLNGKYESASGTSMSTPFVAAAVAMLLTDNPALTVSGVENMLKNIAGDHGLKGKDLSFGVGVLDFGVFFGDDDCATSIDINKSVKTYVSEKISFGPVYVYPDITPLDATNKAYTVKIADPSVAEYDGFGFIGKKAGRTTATFSLINGPSATVEIICEKRAFWVERAADRFSGGTGTKYDPYLVETPEQLARISYMGDKCLLTSDMYFRQTADIDLKALTWYPILSRDADKAVTRINFDGGGYEIRNLNIADIYGDIFIYYGGLFACNEGELKNINMIDVDINLPDSGVAGICVEFGGNMENCYASGKVRGYGAGGLVAVFGEMMGLPYDTSIRNCRSDVDVTGGYGSGGIAYAMMNGTISNCIFTGKTTTSYISGGIVSLLASADGMTHEPNFKINKCKIINCVSVEDIAGNIDNRYQEISSSKIGIDTVNLSAPSLNFSNETIAEIYNCYYSGEVEIPVQSAETDYIMTDVEKADGALFKTKAFYENTKGKWNEEFLWDMEIDWVVDGNYPTVKAKNKAPVKTAFDYHEFDDHITVTGYYGTDPTVEIPSYIAGKPVTFIDFSFMSHNTDVETIKLPDTLRYLSNSAFSYMFGRVRDTLKRIDLGNGIKYIGKHAFYSCQNLKAITIPESVEYMDAFVFVFSGVENIFFEGNRNNISRKIFYSDEKKLKVNIYRLKDKTGWDDYNIDDKNIQATLSTYDKTVPVIAYGNDSDGIMEIEYGKTYKLSLTVFPESASLNSLTYKTSNDSVSVDKYGNVKANTNSNASAMVYVCYNGKTIGEIYCCILSKNFVYSVKFNANGGSGKMNSQTNIKYGESIKLSKNTFKAPSGKYFAGWATSKNGKVVYADCQKVKDLSSENGKSVTLYAVWNTIKYNVKFNSNGGSGKMSTQTDFYYGKSKSLNKCSFKAPKGKVFAGWATSKKGTASYTNGQKVKNLTSQNGKTVTLYAIWVKPETYKIKYDTKGGTLAENTKTKYKRGTGYTLKNPTKKGYIFVGWYTDAKLKKGKITQIKPWSEGTVTLYAKWKAIAYSVKFNANGGSGKMSTQKSFSYNKSKALKKCTFTAPKGKVFAGWATSKKGKAKYTDKQKVKNITSKNGETVTLYALWVTPKTYKIKYDTNGGKLPKSTKTSYKSGTGYTLPKPTRKGYTFVGWYTDKKMKSGKASVIKPWETGKRTFYAKWNKK